MPFIISDVHESDAEQLVRNCDFPAMRDNPLRLIMFPRSTKETEEVEIKWEIEGLRQTLKTKSAGFQKVCLQDGTPVGFAGWSIENTTALETDEVMGEPRDQVQDQKTNWHPETLDVCTWIMISKILREERRRVFRDCNNVWRKFDDLIFHMRQF